MCSYIAICCIQGVVHSPKDVNTTVLYLLYAFTNPLEIKHHNANDVFVLLAYRYVCIFVTLQDSL